MSGIGLGLGIGRSGQGWSSYWTQRSLFFLDGTIIDVAGTKYFKDRSVNARNFLISDYDFDTTWLRGFPYKSAATISAPAGDAVLIAADINNFLYDSGGTPNAIPVVSLFQNIDYENTIYCKHVAQVLDSNGVETTEPHVIEIFMAAAALSATDLVKASLYFDTPVKSGTALWVAKTGNDTTGDGTEALPYLTISKFITVGNTKTGYIRSGAYSEAFTLSNKQLQIHGIGLITDPRTNDYVLAFAGATPATTVKRVWFNSNTNYRMLIQGNCADLVFNNIRSTGTITSAFCRWISGVVSSCTFNDSYFNSLFGTIPFNVTFNGCSFAPAATDYLISTAGGHMIFNHCKIAEITSTGILAASAVSAEFTLFDCEFYGNTYVDAANANAPTININYCNIYAKTKGILGYAANTESRIVNVTNNNITSAGVIDAIFNLIGKGTVNVNYNTITGLLRDFTTVISGLDVDSSNTFKGNITSSKSFILTSNNTNSVIQSNIFNSLEKSQILTTVSIALLDVVVQIIGNTLISPNTENAFIALGTEGGTVSYGRLNGSLIEKNKSLAPQYFGNDPGGQHWALLYASIFEARYNLTIGTFLGYVMKAAGGAYASVVHHNIVVNTQNPFLSKGVSGVCYYNNTAIWDERTHIDTEGGLRIMADELYVDSYSINTKFKNNIIVSFNSDFDTIFIQASTDDLVGFESDYNIYYKGNGLASSHFAYVDSAWLTFVQWQALGFDAHSIILTESQALNLFTDYANRDYSLKAGSLAIGAGVALDAAYDNGLDASTNWGTDSQLPVVVTKQQGASWDIGAYVS